MARENTGIARALVLAIFCVLLPGPGLSASAQNEPIVFLGDHNFPPYEFLDAGTPRGANVDLLNAIGEVLERPIEIRLMKWSEAQDKVLGGDGHALTLMSKNEKRLALYDFSDGTFNITFSLFVKADMVAALDAAGLAGKRIGVVKAGFPQAFLEAHQPEAELVFVDTLLDGFNMLFLGQIDAIGSATWAGYYALSENDIPGIQALHQPFAVKIAGITVPKGNGALVREINRALAEIKRSGRFARIMGKWSRHEVVLLERKEIWAFVAIAVLASIALASLVVLLWVVHSRKITRKRAAEVQAANTVLQEEIAERKQVEDALRESEERLSLAAQSAKFGAWSRRISDDKVVWDAPTEALFGLEPGAFEGTMEAFLAQVHPDDRERITTGHRRLMEEGVPYAADFRIAWPGGEVRHIATRASLVRGERDSSRQIIGMLHDITERKRAEEILKNAHDELESRVEDRTAELRETNERLKGIADNLPGAIYRRVLHADGTITYPFMSDGFHRMFGIDPEKAHADSQYVFDSLHPEDVDRMLNEIKASAEAMGTYDCEYRLIGEGGGITWCRSIARPRRMENGDIVWDGVAVDITERKRAEAALHESESRFRDFAESASDWFWEMDENLRFTYMSPTVERVVGVAPEWHYGKTRDDLLGNDYDRDVWEQHLQTLKARQPFRDFNYFRVGEGVEPKWLSTSGKPVFDPDGNFLGYRGSGCDITELKQREIALRDSEETLREILEKSPIGVAIVAHTPNHGRMEAKRLFANDALVKMFGGTSREGMLESDISGTWVDLDQLYAINETMKNGGDLVDFEARRRRIDGADLWVSMNTRPIRFDDQDCTIVWHFDITERKHAEEVLRESEARLQRTVLDAPIPIMIHAEDGEVLMINQEWTSLTGYTHAEIPTISVWTELAYGSRGVTDQSRERIGSLYGIEEKKSEGDYYITTKTGESKIWDFRSSPLGKLPDGRRFVISMAMDVTDSRMAQVELEQRVKERTAALRESEGRLALAMQSANFGTWSRSIPGDRVIWDERTEAIYGLEPGTFEGTMEAVLARVHPDDREMITTGHRRSVEDGVPYAIDFRIAWPNGEVRHIATRASVVRDDRDSSLQIIGMVHDITERKRTEEALRESEEQLRLITDNVPAVIAYVDANQRYGFINQRYEEWFGISPDEAHGQLVRDVVGEATYDIVKENLAKALSGERIAFETSLPIKDAGLRPVQATYVPHFSDDGGVKGVFVLVTDITERKRLEDELLRRERLATLGQLTATVSHELRNPLGVIRTSAFILRDGLKEEMPRARRALERVERSVIRCDRIIDEMLDFTRIADLEPEPTALDDWLASVLEEQPLPTGISLRQELQLPETTVVLDRDRFRRAVINVFDNACQAMRGEGEGDAETQPGERVLTVRTRERAGRIEVVFEDQGPGIPPDVYQRIFEPLYSTKGFGVGLGLPVVKQIMEQHGGGIEIETVEGRGTTVCLWLDRNALAEHVAA